MLDTAARANAATLRALAERMLKAGSVPALDALVAGLQAGTIAPSQAMAKADSQVRGCCAVLRAFPGHFPENLFRHDAPILTAQSVSACAAWLVELGPGAASLGVAVGERSPDRAARLVAMVLSRHATAPGVVRLVVRRLGDVEPRVAYEAALRLNHFLGVTDARAEEAKAAIPFLAQCLATGEPWQKAAALRAASIMPRAEFVGPLVSLLGTPLQAEAVAALQDITGQEFTRPKQWISWWEDHGSQPREVWLVDALDQANDTVARGALRALQTLTHHHLEDATMDTRAQRRAVRQRWTAWLQQRGVAGALHT